MNIFPLHEDPRQAAKMLCDLHLRKMLVEYAQILTTGAYMLPDLIDQDTIPYKSMNAKDPCVKWVIDSYENWKWLCDHAHECVMEYTRRLKKPHKSMRVIFWARRALDTSSITKPPTAFVLKVYPKPDVALLPTRNLQVQAYRDYYSRKEGAWLELARVRALTNAAIGKKVSRGARPVMVWTSPSSRPDWLPILDSWEPTEEMVEKAKEWGKDLPEGFDPIRMSPRHMLDLAIIGECPVAIKQARIDVSKL